MAFGAFPPHTARGRWPRNPVLAIRHGYPHAGGSQDRRGEPACSPSTSRHWGRGRVALPLGLPCLSPFFLRHHSLVKALNFQPKAIHVPNPLSWGCSWVGVSPQAKEARGAVQKPRPRVSGGAKPPQPPSGGSPAWAPRGCPNPTPGPNRVFFREGLGRKSATHF